MQNNWNFSICISQLLNIFNVTSNKLAKAINVDPSLISRWKTGKRNLSCESSYLKPIANFFSDKVLNDYQKTSIINIPSKFNLPIDIKYSNNTKEYLHILLVSSLQGSNTVQVINNNIGNHNNNLNSNFNIGTDLNENISFSSGSIDNNSSHLQQCTFTENGYISNFEMITGHSNVLNAGINLLKSIPNKPNNIKDSILITFLTELDSFSNFENLQQEWCSALFSAQEKGWNIIKLMNINENISRNMKIINEFLLNIISKNYHPYYFNKYDSILSAREFIIIPSVGTLFCTCTRNPSKVDTALLIRDEQASKALSSAFDLCVNHTKPLITNSSNVQNTDFLTEIANYEELRGDRYTFNFLLKLCNNSNGTY